MRINSAISKLFLAGLFIVVYLNVLFTQFSCGLSHFYEEIGCAQNHNEEQENHEHEELSSHHDADEPHHDHEGTENNCCNDKTSAFFAFQINYQIAKTEIKPIISETIIPTFHLIPHFENLKQEEVIISDKSPPPKISDIKVFLHCFLI